MDNECTVDTASGPVYSTHSWLTPWWSEVTVENKNLHTQVEVQVIKENTPLEVNVKFLIIYTSMPVCRCMLNGQQHQTVWTVGEESNPHHSYHHIWLKINIGQLCCLLLEIQIFILYIDVGRHTFDHSWVTGIFCVFREQKALNSFIINVVKCHVQSSLSCLVWPLISPNISQSTDDPSYHFQAAVHLLDTQRAQRRHKVNRVRVRLLPET